MIEIKVHRKDDCDPIFDLFPGDMLQASFHSVGVVEHGSLTGHSVLFRITLPDGKSAIASISIEEFSNLITHISEAAESFSNDASCH